MKRHAIGAALMLALTGGSVHLDAQEAEVSAAIRETLAAWRDGRFQDFASFYDSSARGFYLDGGPLAGTFDAGTMQAAHSAGFRADVVLRDLEVRVYGETSVAAAYLVGRLTLPGGVELPGTWRYTETRVRQGGAWKVVQFHFSPLNQPAGG